MGDGGVSAYPVIGVGDVHGGDAQEVNEGCVVAARTQSAQAAGRKMFRLQGAGPAHQPGVHIPALGSPGDQAVHRAATVGISDPVVIDAETAGAWCADLSGGGSSLGAGPAPGPTTRLVLLSAHPSFQPTHSPEGPTRPTPHSLSPTPSPSNKYQLQLRLPRVAPPRPSSSQPSSQPLPFPPVWLQRR